MTGGVFVYCCQSKEYRKNEIGFEIRTMKWNCSIKIRMTTCEKTKSEKNVILSESDENFLDPRTIAFDN